MEQREVGILIEKELLVSIGESMKKVGIKSVADFLNKSPATLYAEIDPNNPHAKLSLTDAFKFSKEFNEYDWLGHNLLKEGLQVVFLKSDDNEESKEFLYAKATTRYGEFMQKVTNLSGKISYKDIVKAGMAVRQSILKVEEAYAKGKMLAGHMYEVSKEASVHAYEKGKTLSQDVLSKGKEAYEKGKTILAEKREEIKKTQVE